MKFVTTDAAEITVQCHDLPVANAIFPGYSEPLPCILKEAELVIQLALHEYALATIDLGGG